jgi:hypothetical protein
MIPDPAMLVRWANQKAAMTNETGSRRHPSIQGSMAEPGPSDQELARIVVDGVGIPISEAKVYRLRPGDLLLFTVLRPISQLQADQLKERLKAALGRDDVRVALKTDDVELHHYRPDPPTDG